MKNRLCFLMVAAVASAPLAFGEVDISKLPAPAKKTDVTYAKDIKPILQASCFGCHGEERQKGGLRLDSLEAVLKGGEDGKVVTPKDSAKSQLVIAASQIDPETAMPPKRRGPGGPGGRGFGPGGPNGGPPAAGGQRPEGGPPPGFGGGPGGPGGQGGPRGPGGPGGPGGFNPPKPLTAEQVGLIRAWIDQGAK